uniref:Tobamovirus multiplication protein 3 n=1 Tax=Tetraselmis sp. GSL018 TaxID=582737 RepID=A0A061S9W7_9CHLO|mmetsp:Transcript_28191/g.66951  ORF Transcript_28191/g.66951 Transcript_28191/m.66951 type:complete len:304 (+) Transcript_28191:105-1016(+)
MTRSSWLSLSGNPRHAIVFTTLSHLPAWWQTVDGNPSWQSGVFFGLAGAYGIIGLVAVVQLIRIQLRVPEYGWTTQKMFHLLNFIVCVLRMSVFVLREPIASLKPVALQSVLLDLPGLLFTTTYTLLVLFWAEIYHQAKTLPTGNLRPTFIAFNLLVYAIQVGIWCFIAGSEKGSNLRIARSLSAGFMGLVALAAAGGFILYGGRLFLMLRGFPVDSRGRKKKIQEVGMVTSICTLCFLVRALLVYLAAFDPKDCSLNVVTHPLLNLIYYLMAEVLPSALVLYILRKLPPKRNQQGYQSIPTK